MALAAINKVESDNWAGGRQEAIGFSRTRINGRNVINHAFALDDIVAMYVKSFPVHMSLAYINNLLKVIILRGEIITLNLFGLTHIRTVIAAFKIYLPHPAAYGR